LNLTDNQKSELKKLDSALAQKRRASLPRRGRGESDPEKMRSAMDKLRREQDEGVAKILDKKQKERLGEIELQGEGIFAVARAEVAKKLKLTSDQSANVKSIVDEMRQAERDAMPPPPEGFAGPGGGPPGGGPPGEGGFPGGGPPGGGPPDVNSFPGGGPPGEGGFPGGGPPGEGGFQGGQEGGGGPPGPGNEEFRARFDEMRKTMDKIRTTATTRIKQVLSPEQQAAFTKMQGKPFNLASLRPGTGPGSGPRNARTNRGARPQSKQRSRQEPETGDIFIPFPAPEEVNPY
jgi:hypothetical protein